MIDPFSVGNEPTLITELEEKRESECDIDRYEILVRGIWI